MFFVILLLSFSYSAQAMQHLEQNNVTESFIAHIPPVLPLHHATHKEYSTTKIPEKIKKFYTEILAHHDEKEIEILKETLTKFTFDQTLTILSSYALINMLAHKNHASDSIKQFIHRATKITYQRYIDQSSFSELEREQIALAQLRTENVNNITSFLDFAEDTITHVIKNNQPAYSITIFFKMMYGITGYFLNKDLLIT